MKWCVLIILLSLFGCTSKIEECNNPKRPWYYYDGCSSIKGTRQYQESHPSNYTPKD